MWDELDLPFGLVLCVLFSLIGAGAILFTRHHRDSTSLQIRLFIYAYALRFGAAIAIYQFGLVSVLGDEDSSGWMLGVFYKAQWDRNMVGLLDLPAVLSGAFEGHHRGYGYLLGLLFYVTDSPGRMPAAALNCFLGALTVVFAYRIARSLFSEWVAVRVGWLVCLFPSLIIWSAQTLKEPVIILLETVALYGCVRLKVSGFSAKHILLCAFAIMLVIPFRFYAAYVAGAAVTVALILPNFKKGKFSVASALGVAAVIIPLFTLSGVLVRHEAEFERFDINRIEKFRGDISQGTGAGSGVRQDYDLDDPAQFATAALVGGAYILFAPFPWQLLAGGSTRMLLTAPEVIIWWLLFILGVVPGFWYTIRNKFNEVIPMLVFIFGLGLLYSVMFGNVGLAYRHRAQLLPWLLILAAVGLEQRMLRRISSQPGAVDRPALAEAQR
ncbi:MAG TPA: glycosyltransferase family 39 protein [Blastocatellia bacterium]|nr:glycosyltransferase family 39 protein [Blastocatellia bacterium]